MDERRITVARAKALQSAWDWVDHGPTRELRIKRDAGLVDSSDAHRTDYPRFAIGKFSNDAINREMKGYSVIRNRIGPVKRAERQQDRNDPQEASF